MENKMKSLILIMVATLSLSSQSFELEPGKETEILKNLAEICTKVWCTGTYQIKFNSFKCKELPGVETKCILSADFKKNNVKEYDQETSYLRLAGLQKSYPGICYFNMKKESELSQSDGEITKRFYKDVDICVTQIERFIEK